MLFSKQQEITDATQTHVKLVKSELQKQTNVKKKRILES